VLHYQPACLKELEIPLPIAWPRSKRSRGINISVMADFSSPLSVSKPGTVLQMFSLAKPIKQHKHNKQQV